MIDIKFKKLDKRAEIPKFATGGAAGFDIKIIDIDTWGNRSDKGLYLVCNTGLAVEIPEGYFMMIVPRSSTNKKGFILANTPAIIDSDYRGEILIMLRSFNPKIINEIDDLIQFKGSKIKNEFIEEIGKCVQGIILPYPKINIIEVDELSETKRGENGFGSTGI